MTSNVGGSKGHELNHLLFFLPPKRKVVFPSTISPLRLHWGMCLYNLMSSFLSSNATCREHVKMSISWNLWCHLFLIFTGNLFFKIINTIIFSPSYLVKLPFIARRVYIHELFFPPPFGCLKGFSSQLWAGFPPGWTSRSNSPILFDSVVVSIFFSIFTPGNDPIWLIFFCHGLQPPPSFAFYVSSFF